MQYFIGSAICLLIFYVLSKSLINKHVMNDNIGNDFFAIKYSQSHIHSMIKPLLPPPDVINAKKKKKTQSSAYLKKNRVKVLIIEGKAYWKKNNVLYVADVIDDQIEKDQATVVDIMGMDKVELDKMLFIVDQLTEGEDDDSSSAGN